MKNSDILKILYDNKGSFISGEDMAARFGISRAALSKRILKLKEKGIEIVAITNKGYKLISLSDNICEENVNLGPENNSIIGKNILVFEEIDSTNEYAKKIAKESDDGTVVLSNKQLQGKGRRGKEFTSEEGGLYFSIILKPTVDIEKISFLTQVSACSVYKALEDFDIQAKIKWPNDILLNDKKVCGILCEMSSEMDYVSHVIVGIGINVYQTKFHKDIADIATSIKKEGYDVGKLEFFWKILEYFECFYSNFKRDENSEMINILRNNSAIIGKDINILSSNKIIATKALDIDEKGYLKVQYENGKIESLNYGEISVRKA